MLRGFGSCLANFDALYVEISDQALYKGGTTVRDIIRFLDAQCFALVHLENVSQFPWGNALFVARKPAYGWAVRNALSAGRPSRQSSLYKGSEDFSAAKGNSGTIDRESFFHTAEEENPWWEVDLQQITQIKGVYIFERIGYAQRSKDLLIELSNDGSFYRTVFSRHDVADHVGQNYFIRMDDAARYVRVRLDGRGYLHLCQVAVV